MLTIVPILSGIVLGHVGYRATEPKNGRHGRTTATIGLTVHYVFFAFFVDRLLAVIIAVIVAVSDNGSEWEFFAQYFSYLA